MCVPTQRKAQKVVYGIAQGSRTSTFYRGTSTYKRGLSTGPDALDNGNQALLLLAAMAARSSAGSMKVLCERSWYVVGVVNSWVCGSAKAVPRRGHAAVCVCVTKTCELMSTTC